jgi:hypothetical protein
LCPTPFRGEQESRSPQKTISTLETNTTKCGHMLQLKLV